MKGPLEDLGRKHICTEKHSLASPTQDLKIEKIARGLHRRDMKKNEAIYEVGSEVVSVPCCSRSDPDLVR